MPTIVSHAIVPLAGYIAAGPSRIAPKMALAGMALAMVPDADVVGFALGVNYSDDWGHRGATHSLGFAVIIAGLLAAIWEPARSLIAFIFLAFSLASHGLLDMATDGGLGIALYWPFDEVRLFWPQTPIRVSPIGSGFFSGRGLATLWSEAMWIWLPCGLLGAAGWWLRRSSAARV